MALIPQNAEEAAAVIMAVLMQAGLILSIAIPKEPTGWAAFGLALLVAAVSPTAVISQAKRKLGVKKKDE